MSKQFSEKELKVLSTMFPMWKIEMEDTYRYRDVDSDIWVGSDPADLLRTGFKSVLYIKENIDQDWVKLPGLPKDLVAASLRLQHIKESYSHWKSCFVTGDPVMFSYENQMFRLKYVWFNEFCIYGEPIEPDKYYCEDGGIKIDFSVDNAFVFTYSRDEMVYDSGQVYMNGELLLSRKDLRELQRTKGIEVHWWDNFWNLKLLDYIKKHWPQAKRYNGWLSSGPFPWTVAEQRAAKCASAEANEKDGPYNPSEAAPCK